MQLPPILEGLGREDLGEVLSDRSWHPPYHPGLQMCISSREKQQSSNWAQDNWGGEGHSGRPCRCSP